MNAHLHPIMQAALAPFAPNQTALRVNAYAASLRRKPEPEPVEYEEGTCASCAGSGEGMYDGQTCHACKGSGSQMYPVYAVEQNDELEAE